MAATGPLTLPLYIDLGATGLYAFTGAMAATRRHYDVVGLVALALVSSVGGALLRDGLFIQGGPPVVMKDGRYLLAVGAGCLAAGLLGRRIERLQRLFLLIDALGLGAYAAVGVDRALGAGLSAVAAVLVGVVNACGGGLLRDALVREEPLVFKPGQFYALAALLGAGLFTTLVLRFSVPSEPAALVAIGVTFAARLLSIRFNLKTLPVTAEPTAWLTLDESGTRPTATVIVTTNATPPEAATPGREPMPPPGSISSDGRTRENGAG